MLSNLVNTIIAEDHHQFATALEVKDTPDALMLMTNFLRDRFRARPSTVAKKPAYAED